MLTSWLKKIIEEKELPKSYIRFYLVGILLYIIPYTHELFIHVISFSLLLVIVSVFYHNKDWSTKTILVYAFIAISSFVLELIGVNTGKLFGHYVYETGLGLKLWNTPLLIGINWVFLIYATHSFASRYASNPWIRILLGSVLMIVYDLVLELVAPSMQMWYFSTGYPPFDNFLVWFVASLFFHSIIEVFKVRINNKSAESLFGIQILFFAVIYLYELYRI